MIIVLLKKILRRKKCTFILIEGPNIGKYCKKRKYKKSKYCKNHYDIMVINTMIVNKELDINKKNNICSICWDSLEYSKVKKTKCNHIYHKKCLNKWLTIKKSCPLCRKSL